MLHALLALTLLLLKCARSASSSLQASSARSLNARDQVPFLGVNNFISIAYHASIVIDDVLYIDGGEVSYQTNGIFQQLAPTNVTLAIDLSKSWAPSSIDIQVYSKTNGPPSLNYGKLWASADGKSFYAYGGVPGLAPNNHPPNPPNSLWQFSDGGWTEVTQPNGNLFPSLTRPAVSLAASGNGVGYMLGGYDSLHNVTFDPNRPWTPVPGILSYNMTTGAWTNSSATGFSQAGTAFVGALEFVPIFGSNGLLIAMGGETSSSSGWWDVGQNLNSFANISVYDPSTQTWYWQNATGYTGPGDIPGGSSMFCYAGVQSSETTYEM